MIYRAWWPSFSKALHALENQSCFTTIHNELCNKLTLAHMYCGAVCGNVELHENALEILQSSEEMKSHPVAQILLGDIYYAQEFIIIILPMLPMPFIIVNWLHLKI